MIAAVLLAAGLFEQSMAKFLEQRFADPNLSYVVMCLDSADPFAARWPDIDTPIAPGSLLKPFLATQAPAELRYQCRPGRCWLPRGHGRIDVVHAIAESCNDWFRQYLAQHSGADPQLDIDSRIGLGSGVTVSPLGLLRDYARIRAPLVLRGMALSARSGTGRLVDADCLIKTGTAPCAHDRSTPGDGLALCLFPAAKPRFVLLVRVHGTTGANAAKTAGHIVRSFRVTP